MGEETKVPKAVNQQVADLEKRVEALEAFARDAVIALQDIIKFNGRGHMPDGKHYGVEF